jgi:EAL domain-containing protein (putative c-di-GMP-specific phosphodiesterase class I)/GGDEF domain-containing protein
MSWSRSRRVPDDVGRPSSRTNDLSPVALIGVGAKGAITSWNRAASSLLGWSAVDVVGRPVGDVLGTDLAPSTLHGRGVVRTSERVLSATGRQVDVDVVLDAAAETLLTSDEYMVALVPAVSEGDMGASPRIDNWVDAAGAISAIGGVIHCVAIGLVGVDAVNRGYSRSTGDAVLHEVAARLTHAVGEVGRAMRIGGNQFVVVAPSSLELDPSRLVSALSQPITTRLGTVRIGAYAGSVSADSRSGVVVLGRADAAMRRAQARGIGAVEHVRDDVTQLDARERRLSSLLIDAVARREISVVFQPVVDLDSGHIIEFEALARWTSSELGQVSPAAFIEAAEDAGLIHDLGQIVLAGSLDIVRAERLAGRWGTRRVSVNLSAVQLSHPDLTKRVLGALAERDLPGDVLQLELTGSRLFPDVDSIAPCLVELRDHGVRLAIDDFGTGCGNLSTLRDLPIDAIKIHGRFVADMCTSRADTAVVRAIVSLARELGAAVMAVGVETAEQHFALSRLGCDAALGFLYSGDRDPPYLYQPIRLPDRPQRLGVPYPDNEIERLEALHFTDVLDTPAEEVYDEIVRAAADLCDTPISLVSLVDQDRNWFKAKVGLDIDQTPRDMSFSSHAICSDVVTEVADAHDDERFASNPLMRDHPSLRFFAGAPLQTTAGYSFGTLCVIDTVPRVLTPEQRAGLSRLARQVTVLLELRGLANQLKRAHRELECVRRERDAVQTELRHLMCQLDARHDDDLRACVPRPDLGERIRDTVEANHAIDLRNEASRREQFAEEGEVDRIHGCRELVECGVRPDECEPRAHQEGERIDPPIVLRAADRHVARTVDEHTAEVSSASVADVVEHHLEASAT